MIDLASQTNGSAITLRTAQPVKMKTTVSSATKLKNFDVDPTRSVYLTPHDVI